MTKREHLQSCASLCTNYNGTNNDGPCILSDKHNCWCPDGSLSYEEFQAKHPESTVAEA
jgi:hypothetical protein